MAIPVETSYTNLSAAYKAARRTDNSSLDTLGEFWKTSQVNEPIDDSRYTILHFLAFYGNFVAIRWLRQEKLLTMEQLVEVRDVHGDTALHVAVRFGHLNAVKEILDGDETIDILSSVSYFEDTPIYAAAKNGKREIFYYLMKKMPSKDVAEATRKDGNTVLHVAIEGQFLDLAYSILKAYPQLADKPNAKGATPLYLLACNKSSFKSGSNYSLLNLSSSPFIPWRMFQLFFYYICFTPLDDCNSENRTSSRILAGYRKFLKVLPSLKTACEGKERHVYAEALGNELVKAQQEWPRNTPNEVSLKDPLIEAVRNRIMELVKLILEKFPEAATVVDKNQRNILHVAAQRKDPYMYEFVKRKIKDDQHKLLSDFDRFGNTAFHLAAGRGKSSKTMYSPLYDMAWDVFWFKHVKMDTPAHLIRHQNSKGLTAKEIFKDSHISETKEAQASPGKPEAQGNQGKHLANDHTLLVIEALENSKKAFENCKKAKETPLIKEAEEDAKRVNEGLMLVSVLISTINFAAIFTIPGGFNQDIGIPLFFLAKSSPKDVQLGFFLLYIGVSLLASLVALGTQLSIHLSRFRKVDFYYILPTKIFIATTALYYSTTFAITACFQAYILEEALEDKVFAGMAVACIPAALVYFDLVYYIMNYLFFPIWYKFLDPPRKVIRSLFSRCLGKP